MYDLSNLLKERAYLGGLIMISTVIETYKISNHNSSTVDTMVISLLSWARTPPPADLYQNVYENEKLLALINGI